MAHAEVVSVGIGGFKARKMHLLSSERAGFVALMVFYYSSRS